MNYWIFKFFYKKKEEKKKQTKETHPLPFTPLQHKTVSWQVFFISEKIVILGSKIKDMFWPVAKWHLILQWFIKTIFWKVNDMSEKKQEVSKVDTDSK